IATSRPISRRRAMRPCGPRADWIDPGRGYGRRRLSFLPAPARGGDSLAVPAFGGPAGAGAILSRILPAGIAPPRPRAGPTRRGGAARLPGGNVPAGPRHRGVLSAAQDELRAARQPGAAPALAFVPALSARSRCAPTGLAALGPRRAG